MQADQHMCGYRETLNNLRWQAQALGDVAYGAVRRAAADMVLRIDSALSGPCGCEKPAPPRKPQAPGVPCAVCNRESRAIGKISGARLCSRHYRKEWDQWRKQ